ncbi:WXG100 family type VII secretion target [Nocardia fusca]|uniref:WXG100 family type VII secretion target n=1 Tax=Nocardia fusca TaxID=941183 RepID=UPI0018DB6635|nr:WXG100 family type VII secretion target [Nocardia fusca]
MLDLLRNSAAGPALNRPVNDVLRDMGLGPLPELPAQLPLPELPPLPALDLSLLTKPIAERIPVMATEGVDLDLDAVTKATREMYQAIENLRLSVKAVDSASDAVRAGWKGTSQDKFYQVSSDWSVESENLNRKLDDLTKATEDATKTILDMDEDDFIPGGGYISPGSYTSL